MHHNFRISLIALPFVALFAVACSKSDGASGSTTTTSGASAADACASKLAGMKPGASDNEKKAFATACNAMSAKARDCIAKSSGQKDMDACVTEKDDKMALFGAMLGAAATESAQKTSATKLEKLGVQLDIQGEALVGDGLDKTSQMVNATSLGALLVSEVGKSSAKTLKAAKSEAGLFKPRNVQGETQADGYWLTFENTGSMGTNYWVKTRKQLGAKSYECGATVDTADKAAAALSACKTLRI
jgi:hypothetical protein